MALYFFDVHDGIHVKDETGQEHPDLESARIEAMHIAAGYASSPKMLGNTGGAIIIVVRNESDDVAMNVRLVFSVETRVVK